MNALLRPALMLFATLTLLTGVVYPLAVTGVGQLLFADAANGSIVTADGKAVGSALIGQQFSSPGYFWGRPSATGPYAYNGAVSSGSNLGPLNPALSDAVKARIEALEAADPGNDQPVPIDLVTASGSGLDPEISLAAAHYQVTRIATTRKLPVEKLEALIEQHAAHAWLGVFGEPRVNVLALNLALDGVDPDYDDYKLGLSKSFEGGWTLGAGYVTATNDDAYTNVQGLSRTVSDTRDVNDATVVVSAGRAF